jgi:Holliday junction resolvase RusA-like endonuclease
MMIASSSHLTVVFSRLPLPPTSNKMYSLVRRGFKTFHVASRELKAFQKAMAFYAQLHQADLKYKKGQIHEWIKDGRLLRIESIFYFRKDRLFTKKDAIKKLDVSNRLKALHDCLCDQIDIDDSLFFEIEAAKCISAEENDFREDALVSIMPCRSSHPSTSDTQYLPP